MFYLCSYSSLRTIVKSFFATSVFTFACTSLFQTAAYSNQSMPVGLHQYEYQVFVGGFEVAKLEINYQLDTTNYTIKSRMEGVGFLQSLLGVEGQFTSTGQYNADGISPLRHMTNATWRNKKNQSDVHFQDGKTPTFTYSPADKRFETEKFPEGILKHTIDPPALSVMIANQLYHKQHCDLTQKLFTGRHRLDVISKDMGDQPLPSNDIVGAHDNVRLCHITAMKLRPSDKPKEEDPVTIRLYMVTDDVSSPPYPILIDSDYESINGKVWMISYRFQS